MSLPRFQILQAPPRFSATAGMEQRRLQDDVLCTSKFGKRY
jgi:hypothetical protein